jgi:ABC-type multidrug transport system fused ATPase/permease subunit
VAAGEWVALVGPTGSGKSTLVDLLLGLLAPSAGALYVDGKDLRDAGIRRGWQAAAAYVPQTIFLLDDTVERNIAFGVPEDAVDRPRLEWAARMAQIHEFVRDELPAGYRTAVGERGVRLSGGQRQRIGVARALYRRPRFLVLDEATSALDNETEQEFFRSLRGLPEGTTVVAIAHRLSSVRHFSRVVLLRSGRIADDGAFADVAARHPRLFADAAGAPGTGG